MEKIRIIKRFEIDLGKYAYVIQTEQKVTKHELKPVVNKGIFSRWLPAGGTFKTIEVTTTEWRDLKIYTEPTGKSHWLKCSERFIMGTSYNYWVPRWLSKPAALAYLNGLLSEIVVVKQVPPESKKVLPKKGSAAIKPTTKKKKGKSKK